MTQPETNTGLLVEFDSVRMRSNLVLVAIYKKGQNFPKLQNFKLSRILKLKKKSIKMIKFSKSFHKISIFEINAGKADFSTTGSAGLKTP